MDPIGLAAGVNPAAYCRGSPVTLSDPTGLADGNPLVPDGMSYDEGYEPECTVNVSPKAVEPIQVKGRQVTATGDSWVGREFLKDLIVPSQPRGNGGTGGASGSDAGSGSGVGIDESVLGQITVTYTAPSPEQPLTSDTGLPRGTMTIDKGHAPTDEERRLTELGLHPPQTLWIFENLGPSLGASIGQVTGNWILGALVDVTLSGAANPVDPTGPSTGVEFFGRGEGSLTLAGTSHDGASPMSGPRQFVGSGPSPGVIGAWPSSGSTGALRNYQSPGGKPIEFLFDPSTSMFLVGKGPARKLFSPHERIAGTVENIPFAESGLVGGMLARGPGGEFVTNENSGHYGSRWTDAVRQQFVEALRGYTGQEVIHQEWNPRVNK